MGGLTSILRQIFDGTRSLLRGEPDVVIRWAGLFLIVGMLTWYVSSRFHSPGAISAVFAIGLGAIGGSLMKWQTERGLWMLAGFFLLIDCGLYGVMTFCNVRDMLRGVARGGVGLVLDFSVGTSLLSTTVRFLWRVARYNWTLSRESSDA